LFITSINLFYDSSTIVFDRSKITTSRTLAQWPVLHNRVTHDRSASSGNRGQVGRALALGALLAKRAKVIGRALRSRPLEQKAALTQSFARDVLPLMQSRAIKPMVDCAFPMTEIREAHRRTERNQSFGKIVLSW
jgi:NADPH:quinone reductase-like Zn-dependent oxidoreductase